MSGFKVYIDESGDEGFVFPSDRKGSSDWFVLSAVITRAETDIDVVKLVDRVRATLQRGERYTLHFRKLLHHQRLPLLDEIAKAKLRTVSVLAHKRSLLEPEAFHEKHALYRYLTRYLLERVSWFCRDHRRDPSDRARLIFSNRSNMSYADLRNYLRLLRERSDELGCTIDWSVFDEQRVETAAHESKMGLQIADAVASSMFFGVEKSQFGHAEPRYAKMLKPTVYNYQGRGRWLGYGFKLFPKEVAQLIRTDPELVWIGQTFPG